MQDNARVQRRGDANFVQKSCKKLQNFWKSGTPRTQKNAWTRPACAVHASRRRRELAESALHSDPKKASVQRRNHTNFAPNSREKIAKLLEIRHAPRTKKCMDPASVRCACFTTSPRVGRVSIAFGRCQQLTPPESRKIWSFRKKSKNISCVFLLLFFLLF